MAEASEFSRANPSTRRRLFGAVAVMKGYCTQSQLDECLDAQGKLGEMGLPEKIGEILVKKAYLTREQLAEVLKDIQGNPTLAGFEILEKVGQGAMGAVFKARQISMHRIVALKILPKKLSANAVQKERFLRGAKMAARLNHPHIVGAIDIGESGPYTYFAMEFVEGRSTRDVVKERGKYGLQEGLELIRQISEALKYAHGQGLIHRDIKPDNVMLNTRNEAKLCDLGLARPAELEDDDAELTMAGKAIGTPHYMSPEQAKGARDIDHRVDLYALGATIYYLFGARTLFAGENPSLIMSKHLTESAPALNEVNPEVPAELALMVSKLLAKDPNDRYPDAGAFLADLDRLKKGEQIEAAAFNRPSSAAQPKLAARSGKRKAVNAGGTTGPRVPVGPKGTTGPRVPVGPRHTTGPVGAIGPIRVTTGPVTAVRPPVRGTARAGDERKKSNGTVLAVTVAGGVGLALLLVLLMLGGSPKEAAQQPKPPAQPLPPPKSAPIVQEPPATRPAAKTEVKNSEPPAAPVPTEPVPSPQPVAAPADQPPVPPQEPAPAQVEPAPQPAPPEPALPALPQPSAVDPALVALRARFLTELLTLTADDDLDKAHHKLRARARTPEFAPAAKLIEPDLKELEAAHKFETAALEALAKQEKELPLPEKLAKTFGADKAKVKAYDAARGIEVEVKGAGLYLTGKLLDAKRVVAASGAAGDGPEGALYLLMRGALDEARARIPALAEEVRAPLAEKLELMGAGEKEVLAQQSFAALQKSHDQKQWKTLADGIDAFRETHGATRFAQQKAPELEQWLKDIEKALIGENPWKRIFHAKEAKPLPNGFVELAYDFSDPGQLADFEGVPAALVLENGALKIPAGPPRDEFCFARFKAPIAELLRFHAEGRSLTGQKRVGPYFLEPGSNDGARAPRLLIRPYNRSPHIENFMSEADINQPCPRLIGKPFDITQDFAPISASVADGKWSWTVGADLVGVVQMPKTLPVYFLILNANAGEHAWRNLKLTIRPEAAWAKAEIEKAAKP